MLWDLVVVAEYVLAVVAGHHSLITRRYVNLSRATVFWAPDETC